MEDADRIVRTTSMHEHAKLGHARQKTAKQEHLKQGPDKQDHGRRCKL
jgi:hypothetical protein